MARLSARIVGDRDLSGRFVKRIGRRRIAANRFAGRFSEEVVKPGWAGRTRSGRVASNIRVEPVGSAPTRFEVYVDSADIGFPPHVVERDTKPHRIEPTKPHGLLVFPVGEQTVFVKGGVNHPGTTGDHALRRTLNDTAPAYREGLRRIWGGEAV